MLRERQEEMKNVKMKRYKNIKMEKIVERIIFYI